LHTARRSVWTRVMHCSGLERPHFVATETVAVAPAHKNAAKHSRAKGVVMLLATQKSYELLAKYGFFACEICNKCGIVLGAVRFTRRDESWVWCSPECRGDGDRRTIRKGGRPRKYKTENDRRQAERRQNAERQMAFRVRVRRNGKPFRSFAETKDLQAQKTHLSHYPLTPDSSAPETGFRKGGSTSD
jgi:hypothetical protein